MNLPVRRWEGFEIGQQLTHGESHPEHFLVKTRSATTLVGPATPAKILLTIGQMLHMAPVCPLSTQKGKQVMQKIHRLTDN
jgi:hypothetical protein